MKYDILDGFKAYLQENLSKNTAKTYFSAVNMVFKEVNFRDLGEIPEDYISKKVGSLTTKNKVSAAKNGLMHLKKYDSHLNIPSEETFKEISVHKRNRVKSRGKKVDFDQMQRKVNAIQNRKLKLAYRLASISGLRVSELADLEARDVNFSDDGKISVNIRNGKGGKNGQVDCLEDKYLYDNLKAYCQDNKNGKLFYSESYMRQKAWEMGIEMHDFRRAYATLKKIDCINHGDTAYEANAKVQEGLRHARFSTTKRYLYGRKIITKYKKINKAVVKPAVSHSGKYTECSNYTYDLVSTVDAFDLSEEEMNALHEYSTMEYNSINEYLYNPNFKYKKTYGYLVDVIENCINRKKIPDDMIVYRGVHDPSLIFKRDINDLSIEQLNKMFRGKIMENLSFMSTSISKHVADFFTGPAEYGGIILKIRAPKGSNGIFMGDISAHKEEKEVLFQKNTAAKINKIYHNENGNVQLDVTLSMPKKEK